MGVSLRGSVPVVSPRALLVGYAGEGAKFLDEVRPTWFGGLKPRRLKMNDGAECVLGQLYGHYADGANRLGLTAQRAGELGFVAPVEGLPILEAYAILRLAWILEIQKRRDAARKKRTTHLLTAA